MYLKYPIFIICFLSFITVVPLFPKASSSAFIKEIESQYFQFSIQAEQYRLAGEFEKSIDLFEKSFQTAEKLHDTEKECIALMKLGLLYWNTGKLNISTEKYSSALAIAKNFNLNKQQEEIKNALEIFNLYSEGKNFRSSRKYQESIESFRNAIELARKTGSREHELKCLRHLSVTYLRINNLQEFRILNEKALQIAKNLNHRTEEGRCLNNLGSYYKKFGNYSKAIGYYEKALETQDEKNQDISYYLNNIGTIYKNIGNYDKALEYLTEALNIDKQSGDEKAVSMDLTNIGITFRLKSLLNSDKEDAYRALGYYFDSLKLAKKNKYTEIEIKVLNNIGSVNSFLGNNHESLKYFNTAYEKAEQIQYIEAMGMVLTNMGIVHYNQGNYEESTKYYQRAIELAMRIEGGQILWEAYLELANAYKEQNKYKEALESYKNSIKIIEDMRSQIKLEELKASFLGTDKRLEAFQNLIDLLVTLHHSAPEKGYDSEAFDYLERAKARAFLDSLERSKVDISGSISSELKNRETELMKDISNIYTKLLAAELSPEEKTIFNERLKEKENELESLKREMRTKNPAYTDLKYPGIITLEEAQKNLLDGNTAFLAYSIGEKKSYAFAITKKGLKIFSIPSRKDIYSLVKDYREIIQDKENHDFKPGYSLYCSLVLPGLDKKIKNIIFIPDDFLHALPFEALVTDEIKNRWLIEDYKIAYAPSVSSLWEIIKRKRSNGKKREMDLLAVGDPDYGSSETNNNGSDIFQNFYSSNAFNFYRLKYSGIEIERISSLFKNSKRTVFQRKLASEEEVINHNLENYKIIHFAAHSLIDNTRPARSSIVLKLDDDPEQDGFLQMREIFNLKLNSDLVTLSACQTGWGQLIRGEGIEGLNRSFFYAGSSSILMSLWAVNDQATYQLMERFYIHLRSSQSIMNALRKAKLEMITSDTLSHPYYWAGFIISGKADQIIFPKPIKKWIFYAASLLLAGSFITAVIKRKISN